LRASVSPCLRGVFKEATPPRRCSYRPTLRPAVRDLCLRLQPYRDGRRRSRRLFRRSAWLLFPPESFSSDPLSRPRSSTPFLPALSPTPLRPIRSCCAGYPPGCASVLAPDCPSDVRAL